ncbi:MAG TPA: tetratricopeptide repeat protein, partial [bacterium]|nr:tetratricopeptide repeat protein [bacterium]
KNQLSAAAAVYESLRKREPENFWGWLRGGNVLRKQGRPDAALAMYERVAEIVPRYAGARTMIGKARLESGLPAEARRAFEEALARDPDDVDAQEGLALASASARESRGANKRPSREGRKRSDRTASFEPKPC